MANQYITYLLIFVVGLTLVIFSDSIFFTLTDDFKNSVAEPELQEITDNLRDQIIEGLSFVQKNPEVNLMIDLDLPITLANKFTYEIRMKIDSQGNYLLNATTKLRNSKNLIVTTNLGINENQIDAQGVIVSTNIDSTLLIAYNDDILTVEIF